MALGLTSLTPKRREQQLSFETASLNGSSSPAEPEIISSPRRDRSSPQKFTFTPQRAKTLPRAWERRPATPYLARNEAQKIWKRVPLGSITSTYSDSWNKANRGPIMRPVKKLRVTQIGREEDKENIDYIASKWDDERKDPSSPKRKVTGFTAINREGETACYTRPSAVTTGDASATALGDAVTTDSDFPDDEDLEDSHDQFDLSSSEHTACSTSNGMDSLVNEEELASISKLSDDQCMGDSSALEDNTAGDAPVFGQTAPGPGEGYEPPTISIVAEASIVPAQAGTNNAVSVGEDDTAFLHDFLSRARAQKAARQQPEQPSDCDGNSQHPSEAMDIEEEVSNYASPVKRTEDVEGRTLASESDTVILQPDAQPESNQLSPCRRSSRLITRLPRPQKPSTTLPSSIALKRLTGTEFISQKETQSVALMTRSNTKRNKGVAKSVQERLMQLDAEAKARDPTTDLTENGRKRRKKAKEVTWAVQLTRFQIDTPVLCSSTEEPEQPEQTELSVAPDIIKEETFPAGNLESVETVTEEEKKQVRKVRKLRKLNVGTYNGTPAPKRTVSLPVPVASAFSIENCKSMPFVTTSESVPDNVIQPEVNIDPTTASAKPKPSTVGSEKRFQTRMRTRNRT